MAKSPSTNPYLNITHLDLAYAVERLVQLGKTNEAEVCVLAAERQTTIARIEARLAALAAGADSDPPAPAKHRYTRRAAQGRAEKPAKAAQRPVGRPKGSKNKPKAPVAKAARRSVGRPKGSKNKPKAVKAAKRARKVSPKMAAARKLQGRYLGLRRQLSPEPQVQANEIAKAQGVGAALAFAEANQPKSAA